MNKRTSLYLFLASITGILILLKVTESLATSAPEVQTQVNKRSDLFEKSINDLPAFTKSLQDGKQTSIDGMGDGKTNTPQGLPFITDKSRGDLQNESTGLGAIGEHDLTLLGREEMIRRNSLSEIYPNYSKPLNKQHMEYAKSISTGQGQLQDNLLAKLKDVGVDCKTIKGDKRHEPEYFLKIKTTQHKDTIYNQTFCEELQNKYNCHDILTVRCNKRKINWGTWQNRIIEFEGSDVFYNHRGWTKSAYYRRVHVSSRGWISMTRIDFNFESSAVLISIGDEIARKLGVLREQITDVEVPVVYEPVLGINWKNPYHGAWFFIEGNTAVFKIIRLHYKFRTREEICGEWVDEWDEVCGLEP